MCTVAVKLPYAGDSAIGITGLSDFLQAGDIYECTV